MRENADQNSSEYGHFLRSEPPSMALTLAYPLRSFTRVGQRGELNRASQLQPPGQQISSTVMSRPESVLMRQD